MYRKVFIAACVALTVCGSSSAWAQDAAAGDSLRFRSGISVGGGMEKVSVVSGGMFGLDGRLGLQWSDLLGFYIQPHLSFGSLSGEAGGIGVSCGTGTLSVAGRGEATFLDRLFVGAGFGYGVLNNPSGPMFQARAGGYLLTSREENGGRRKGLMAGVDMRTIIVEGATGLLVRASIGYEKY